MSVRQILGSKRTVVAAAIPAAVLASGAMVWASSYSAFSATTSNPSSNWAAGNVKLADDDTNAAMFNVDKLKPGSTGTKCIVVTSSGSLASTVKLYGTGYATTKDLATSLNLKVEEGTGGSFSNCTGFTAGTTIFDGSTASFGTTKTDFESGVGTWAPAAGSVSKTYRITYKLADATPSTAQDGTAAVALTWEAQNS